MQRQGGAWMADVVAGDNASFDFISDAGFRASLMSDYRELLSCMENAAWKGVHVLAGSIVEAILADYLVGMDYQKKSGKDPLKMELGPIISACKDEKIITERTADLSSVIRSYRNLIHPGRVIRLNEKIDEKSASIAKALVDVVADEVAAAKSLTYGFTAEQIANKIEKDASALAVLAHFLKETNERERERLVRDVLPERYFLAGQNGSEENLEDYQKCHRETFDTLTPDSKAAVAKRFIKILKEESGGYVLEYENAFFKAYDIEYLAPSDAAFAKAHILSRLEKEQTQTVMGVAEGLGRFLVPHEVKTVVDAYAKLIAYGKSTDVRRDAREQLFLLYFQTAGNAQKELVKRVDVWINFWDEKQNALPKAVLEELKSQWDSDVPF